MESVNVKVDDLISKNANDIFKEYSVSEVETISQNIDITAQKVHEDLQNLVSLKYRDLLKTSDLIIEMNEISKKQDTQLYDLSFLKNGRIEKLFKIEKNLNKFDIVEGEKVDISPKQNLIVQRNREFIRLSNFFNIDENNTNNLEIIELIESNLELPIDLEIVYKSERELILKKFNNLMTLTIRNISNNFKIWEVLKIYKFWQHLQVFKNEKVLNIELIEDEIFKNLIKLINHEFKDEFNFNHDNLILILKEYGDFKDRILSFYLNKVIEIESSIVESAKVDDKDVVDEKLNLYELDFNAVDYLKNVDNLSNGLTTVRYQSLNSNLLEFLKNLNVLQKLDEKIYEENKVKLLNHLNDFKKVSTGEQNKLLTKYLDKLIQQVNK